MVSVQVSGGLIVRDKNLLMVYDEEQELWDVPSGRGERGELSSETAERITEEKIGCECEATRYRGKLKTSFTLEGESFTWQPYDVEIEGEPEGAEWVNVSELDSREVARPLEKVMETLKDRI